MPRDNKHDPFNDLVRDTLRGQGGEKQQQPERSVAEQAQERDAGGPRQQGATPNPADVDRFAEALKKEWGIGSDGKQAERPTASAVPPTRDPRAFEGTSIDITRHVGLNPSGSNGPGAWDHFAKGVKGGLSDFVSRVFGESHTAREPEHVDKEKGMDR